MKLEYAGGHIYSSEEPGYDGENTIISLEFTNDDKPPYIGCMHRQLSKLELQELVEFIYNKTKEFYGRNG